MPGQRQQSFAVYLTDVASIDGDGPLTAESVDFYDSGVWVTHAGGRDFFPYERVVRIREGGPASDSATDAAADAETAAESDEATGERRDAASGTAGAVDETTLDVE